MKVERGLVTRGREENISALVVFPYNAEDLMETFQVEDVNELAFLDNPGSKLSVERFNYIIREADDRIEKLDGQITAVVKFLKAKMKKNKEKEWKKISEDIPLSFEDSIVWYWCMKDHYQHKDELVKVWKHGNELTVLYGAGDAS